MTESCLVIYKNDGTKIELTRRLSVHFKDFSVCGFNYALQLLDTLPYPLWPSTLIIEWDNLEEHLLREICIKLLSAPARSLFLIGLDEEIERTLSVAKKPFHIIYPQNLNKLDLPILLGITGKPIVCGALVLWSATGNVFNADCLSESIKPNEWPIIKLSTRERIRVLEYLMLYAQGPENAKTAVQILDEISDLLSTKYIQLTVTEIRRQIEPIPDRPNSLKSNSGRPGKRRANLRAGYYINIENTVPQSMLILLNEFSANSIFSSSNKIEGSLIRKLSLWLRNRST